MSQDVELRFNPIRSDSIATSLKLACLVTYNCAPELTFKYLFWKVLMGSRKVISLCRAVKSASQQILCDSHPQTDEYLKNKKGWARNNDLDTYRCFLCTFCICSIISTYVSTFLPDSFGNYSHYVFSLMDVNDTGRINFQVQNVQNTDADSIVKHSPLSPFHYPGLSGNSVHHGEGLRQGEDAVGGQALWHRRGRLHQRWGARGRDILGEFCGKKYLDICIILFPRYLIWWAVVKRTRS